MQSIIEDPKEYQKRCFYIFRGSNYEYFGRFRRATNNIMNSEHWGDIHLMTYKGRVCYSNKYDEMYIEFETFEDLFNFKLIFS